MISCKLFSRVYFATPPIPRSCAYFDSPGKFRFRAWIGFQNSMSGRVRASKWGPL